MGNCGSELDEEVPNLSLKKQWVRDYVQYLNSQHLVKNEEHENLLMMLKLLPTRDLLAFHAHYLLLPPDLQGDAAIVRQCAMLVHNRVV